MQGPHFSPQALTSLRLFAAGFLPLELSLTFVWLKGNGKIVMFRTLLQCLEVVTSFEVISRGVFVFGSFENEAPKSRKRSTQRNHCRLKNYNFKSCMTQVAEPGGGNGCVRTPKGPQIHPQVLF